MIKVSIVRDKLNAIYGFKVSGHALFDSKGKDIVCAAASAIAYTALGGLKNVAKIDFKHDIQPGIMTCSINAASAGEPKYKADIILETMYIGFMQLENAYPKNIEVFEEEVL